MGKRRDRFIGWGLLVALVAAGIFWGTHFRNGAAAVQTEILALMDAGHYQEASTVFADAAPRYPSGWLDDARQAVRTWEKWERQYQAALADVDEEDFLSAYDALNLIPSSHPRFAEARAKIEELKTLITDQQMERAQVFAEVGKYQEAVEALNLAIYHGERDEEAQALREQYLAAWNARIEEKQAEQREATLRILRDGMDDYAGLGDVQIAVTDLRDYAAGREDWRELRLAISAKNVSSSTASVSPLDFTLVLQDGQAFNPDDKTFRITGYLESIRLAANTYTVGWLVFIVPKEQVYTLVFDGGLSGSAEKMVVVDSE